MSGLQPPHINTQSTEAHDISESSDEHFSSASEGTPNLSQSPIPTTRVERVDSVPRHGEVPGTEAYEQRTQDAVPDEIEIVPDGQRSRSGTLSQNRSRSTSRVDESSRPRSPGGTPIPKTVIDKIDDQPRYGEVDGTMAKEMRKADAAPDEVRQADDTAGARNDGRIEADPDGRQEWFRSMWEGEVSEQQDVPPSDDTSNDADDDFGDDFDEFAEGGGDDDFGDFDDADPTPLAVEPSRSVEEPSAALGALAGLPPLDLKFDLSDEELNETIKPYLDAIFPDSTPLPSDIPPMDMANSSPFLSDRSLSLWQQLVSPPPMQPPNWTRSRIRRLFLVSLGVPVDLDEILPPSKQKRLVLPNINLGSPRPSTNPMERLKHSNTNDSTTSLDSKTGAPKRPKRTGTAKGPAPPPDFDANGAALVAATTEEAMKGFTEEELKKHISDLEVTNKKASAVLEYWLQRKDESLKEKEALEGVIENLVGFVKGRRGK